VHGGGIHRHSIACCDFLGIALPFSPDRGIHVVTAVITAQGENMNSIAEQTAATPAPAADQPPKATQKAARAPRRAHVAPKKAKAGKKATPAKEAPRGAKKAKGPKTAAGARDGSKTAKVLELLKRPSGVTAKELIRATGWQPHSVRGFLSGTLRKKLGLDLMSAKAEDGERTYSLKA
jgi:hypothetical protein